MHKSKFWDPVYEDSLDLIAKLPALAAAIYRHSYYGGELIAADDSLDWAANLAVMMGVDKSDTAALDMMRMYQTIHTGARPSRHAYPPRLAYPTRAHHCLSHLATALLAHAACISVARTSKTSLSITCGACLSRRRVGVETHVITVQPSRCCLSLPCRASEC